MNPRQAALMALSAVRGVAPALGFHRVRVVLRTRQRTSGKIQTGAAPPVDLLIGSPHPVTAAIVPPHVKGTSGDPEITVGPLTPFDPVAAPRGYTPEQLAPPDSAGLEYFYLVTFPDGVQRPYQLVPRGIDTTTPLRIMVKLRALDRKAPF